MGNEDEAREIAQEVMIIMWKRINSLRTPETLKTWLYRIIVNRCCDEMRKSARNPEIRPDDLLWREISGKISENPEVSFENREIAEIIGKLTEFLSPKQKAVFILSEIEELPPADISEITGMSRVNIKANLWMARKRMSEMIEKYI
jgi:RNA polymerase sigma-70 factor (ECF subfamily)